VGARRLAAVRVPLSGRPSRVETLRTLIEHALAAGDVELVEARELARRARTDDGLERRRLEPVVVEEEMSSSSRT
jgi:hypothetical protein